MRFSAPIAGRVYAGHGTTTETRLTVIDKQSGLTPDLTAAYHDQAESSQALLALVQARCPPRLMTDPAGQAANISPSSALQLPSILSLQDKARSQVRAVEAEKSRHPFDLIKAKEIGYLPKVWAEKSSRLTEALYEGNEVQSITIEGAHPSSTRSFAVVTSNSAIVFVSMCPACGQGAYAQKCLVRIVTRQTAILLHCRAVIWNIMLDAAGIDANLQANRMRNRGILHIPEKWCDFFNTCCTAVGNRASKTPHPTQIFAPSAQGRQKPD